MDDELRAKYDPTKAMKTIAEIKSKRDGMLEGTLTDRNIAVYNFGNINPQAIRAKLAEMDAMDVRIGSSTDPDGGQIEEKPAEPKMKSTGDGESVADVMKQLKELKKNSVFQNKRHAELERVMNAPVHTRATIRIKFPDNYLLQGEFGGLEKAKAIYEFVTANLYTKERKFTLFKTPPKKVYEGAQLKKSMKELGMVPNQILYFQWADLPETKAEHGPFMDMMSLKEYIKH